MNDSDKRRDKRWYKSFELHYWYYDKSHHKQFGSCSYERNFGYRHPSKPDSRYCPGR